MKKVFVVLDAVTFEMHQHPVFTGHIAYDLGMQQEIQVHPELKVREFATEGEVATAINDYMREHDPKELLAVSPFIIQTVYTVAVPNNKRSTVKSIAGIQPIESSKSK